MDSIHAFLERFKILKVKDKDLKEAIAKAIQEATGINVPLEEIKIRAGVAYLNIQPIERSEVYLYKTKILESIQKSFPNFSDLR